MEEEKEKNQSTSDAVNSNGQGNEPPADAASPASRPRMRHRIGRAEKIEPGMSSKREGDAHFEEGHPYRNNYNTHSYDRPQRSYGERPYQERFERSWGGSFNRNESRYENEAPRYSRRETFNNPNAEPSDRYSRSERSFIQRSDCQRQGRYDRRQQESGYRRPYDRPYGGRSDSFNRVDADFCQEGSCQQGEYQPHRPFYNSYNRQGGYQRRDGFGTLRQGEYRQRPSGFVPRQGSCRQHYGAQRQRPHYDGFEPSAKYSQRKVLRYKEENVDPAQPLRLNKFISNAGLCSRREADKFIEAGVVTVNGQVVTELGTKVLRTDEVKIKDQVVKIEDKVYVLLNKPKDYVTTSDDPQKRKTVMDLVRNACPERIYPIGRLDRNTTGVLLLTNDGDMASKLMHPKFMKKKIYHVFLNRPVDEADMKRILEGIKLEDGEIKADAVEYAGEADNRQVGIEIHSGKNRIVRRIFEHLGYKVVKLDRVYFAGLTKKNLRRGDWRFLTEDEVRILRMGAFE